ncbi:beta/gamma crystallin-related protein [Maricaulis maris]|uniref:Beta/gamma crystallin n=1 Tax=Maricaulis maris TaxID=74318 RepID=A0A495D350_9PROT|nr:beta/gamma crystallin-related protein [Maricaulis maris]RKQ95360.1 beta/gamma crystallin [Maricaulis maris]
MTMKRIGQAAISLFLTALAGQASAQSIILFEDSNYRGRQVEVTGDVRNLDSVRFNDRTSSFRIVSGEWELCQHDDYNGTCEIHTSGQASMGRMNDQLTSLRPVAPGRPGRPGGRSGPSLTFYSGPNFTGRAVEVTASTPDFTRIGFNDQARSVRHRGRGAWVACQHANFDGACMVIDGDIANIGGGMGGEISSAEPDYAGRPNRPGRPGGGETPRSGVFLFDGTNFAGQRVAVDADISNLSRMGFNDRADSLIVARGETWIICDDEGFTDSCQRVEGEISDLSRLGLRNRVTSLRRVDSSWGGPGGPNGPGGRLEIRGGTRGVDSLFFPRPEINGYAVDRCLGGYGSRCDQEAADHMCRAAGLRQAAHYSIDRYNRTRTWFIGQNQACTSGQCAALVDVLCTG